MPEYNVGDKVWWAKAATELERQPCPVCFGKQRVVITLGNDEQVSVECDYCGKGWESARGYIEEYVWTPGVQEIAITGKEVKESLTGREVEYRYDTYILRDNDIFSDKASAEQRIKEKIIAHAAEEEAKLDNRQSYSTKSLTRQVGYHRREAKRAQAELEHHQQKAISLATPNSRSTKDGD